VPFVEQEAVGLIELVHTHQDSFSGPWNGSQRIPDLSEHSQAFAISGAAGEGVALDVAGQTYSSRQDYGRLFAASVHPAKAAARKRLWIKAHSIALN
jgi:hypothetical protein